MSFSYTIEPALNAPITFPEANSLLGSTVERDIAIDPSTGDIEIPVRLLVGAEAVLQRVWIRMRFFLGEWFLDKRLGVPWRERILIKGVDVRAVRLLLSRVVAQTPGVASVKEFQASISRERVLTVDRFVAVLDDGSQLEAKRKEPFIV